MLKLIEQLQRLYLLPTQQWLALNADAESEPSNTISGILTSEVLTKCLHGELNAALNLVNADQMARTLVLGLRVSDWALQERVYLGVQADFELPAPALAVAGCDQVQLWFSLAEPVPVSQASTFLDALRLKYLTEMPVSSVTRIPAKPDSMIPLHLVPARLDESGKWSAFIDPTMGQMFVEGAWLEMAPNLDRQADMLAGLVSIKPTDFQRVLNALKAEIELQRQTPVAPTTQASTQPPSQPNQPSGKSTLNIGSHYRDPKSFLLAVMNDPTASAHHRIRAAKALLPYFEKQQPCV